MLCYRWGFCDFWFSLLLRPCVGMIRVLLQLYHLSHNIHACYCSVIICFLTVVVVLKIAFLYHNWLSLFCFPVVTSILHWFFKNHSCILFEAQMSLRVLRIAILFLNLPKIGFLAQNFAFSGVYFFPRSFSDIFLANRLRQRYFCVWNVNK